MTDKTVDELKSEIRTISKEMDEGSLQPVPSEVQTEFLRCYRQGLVFPDWVKEAMPFINWDGES